MANKFVCTLLLLIAAIGAQADGIVGGTPSSISAHPYLASLQLADGTIVCGGALINSKTVVTAASCLANYDVSQFVVGINNGAQTIKIAKSTFNRQYDIETNENDIAIVKLAEAAIVSSYLALASSLPSKGLLVGWDKNNAVVQASETIISARKCVTEGYKYEAGDLFNSQFCGLAENEACGQLPGSPLVADNRLLGVVSWGYGCANKDSPAIYSNVLVLKLWIESVL
ncbi:trypsin theta-like [Rhagoletis pomonella]|uniref:trypsin theta-like n=1 Tax=Rhagoletis pomonella TaxID=28610 RepID=UPI00177E21A7|nr:trypsin theta-like [Rhagoletis pomonella]XP_036344869.1 trypsin theta-like [Rhagoletis pomonella]